MTLLAAGPGEPLGTGGRYDDLLGRYAAPSPATGFAFEVDNVLWALAEAGVRLDDGLPPRVLVAGGSDGRRRKLAETLRTEGGRVATLNVKTADEARRYAQAWGYDLFIWQPGKEARATRLVDGRSRAFKTDSDGSIEALLAWAEARTGS